MAVFLARQITSKNSPHYKNLYHALWIIVQKPQGDSFLIIYSYESLFCYEMKFKNHCCNNLCKHNFTSFRDFYYSNSIDQNISLPHIVAFQTFHLLSKLPNKKNTKKIHRYITNIYVVQLHLLFSSLCAFPFSFILALFTIQQIYAVQFKLYVSVGYTTGYIVHAYIFLKIYMHVKVFQFNSE